MKPEQWQKIAGRFIPLDQTAHGLTIEREDVERHYEPLASWIIAKSNAEARTLVAAAGPPGSGKSAFAAILKVVIDTLAGAECSIVIGQDGWHFPNAYLDTTHITVNGRSIPLRKIKGSQETFDVDGIQALLRDLRPNTEVSFPVYSRIEHDPLPEGGKIHPGHRVIILEGNYLLLDADRWRSLAPHFDIRIFLDADLDVLETCLIERHARGGKTWQEAANHVRNVDLCNARLVKRLVCGYDVRVIKKDCVRIAEVEYLAR